MLEIGESFLPRPIIGRRDQPLDAEILAIRSDRVLGRVVDLIPFEREPQRGPLALVKRRIRALLGSEEELPDAAIERHLRIAQLRGALSVAYAGGGLLELTVAHSDAARSIVLANQIADAFVQYDLDRRRTASERALSWLSQRAEELQGRIIARKEAMQAIVDRLGHVPGQRDDAATSSQVQLQAQRTVELGQARIELLTVEQRIAQLEPLAEPRAAGEAASEQLLAQLDELKAQLQSARLLYTPTHPEVRRLEGAVAELEGQLGGRRSASPSDPQRLEATRELQRLRSNANVLRSRIAAIRRVLAEAPEADPRDSAEAVDVANYERMSREAALDEELYEVFRGRINSMVLSASKEFSSAQVLDYAILARVSNRERLRLLAAGVGGAFAIAFGLAGLLELLDRRAYDVEAASAMMRAPILATIPLSDDEEVSPTKQRTRYTSHFAEAFRRLRTSLIYSGVGIEIQTIAVVSAMSGEGKTTVSSNLAASLAETGRDILLIDGDMRRPRVDQVFELPRSPGLADVLSGQISVEKGIHRLRIAPIDVLCSGNIAHNPTELLSAPTLGQMLSDVSAQYDVVIVDAPVLLAIADAMLLAAATDAVLVVNRPGLVDRSAFPAMAQELSRVRANVLGVVVNGVEMSEFDYPGYLKSPYLSQRRRWGLGRWLS